MSPISSVLIVSYNFPPSTSIGGRRWSFIARELQNLGYEIYVIASDYDDVNRGTCPWINCIKGFEENITYLKNKTPFYVKNLEPKTLVDKLYYRTSLFLAKLRFKGNVYDASLYFAKEAYHLAEKLIKQHKIKNIIVTCGPFQTVSAISSLKNKFGSEINLTIDLRDPWTEEYSEEKLKDKIYLEERNKNRLSLNLADLISMPSIRMIQNNKKLFPNISYKIRHIPHGYDELIFNTNSTQKGAYENWFYAGTVYDNINQEMDVLKLLMKLVKPQLSIFTYSQKDDYKLIEGGNVSWNKLISQDELIKITQSYGIALVLLNEHYKDYFSSKFYELVALGKFILYIGPKGIVSEFISEHKIGYSIYSHLDLNQKTSVVSELKLAFTSFEEKPHLVKSNSFGQIAKTLSKDLKI